MFPAEEIPDTIGTYRIVRRLAPIGPAEVYLARNEGPLGYARECELKLLPDTSDGSGELAEELAREAAICAKMNHPAVVRVFDFFEHRGKLVLALEHVEGASLGDLLTWLSEHRKKLGDTAAYYIGSRIAGAIADAHAAVDDLGKSTPIVHRNLTPDNVLVAVDGEVRLTGFGVGKILGRTPDTAIGRIKGTPGFMAPEQTRGEPVTTKADVYGLGLLMWSLLAGKRPPTDGTWPRRISGIRTDLPREVAAVVDAALDHFPGTRKISAREIDQWLSKAAPAAKGKAELRDHLAAMRGESVAKDEPPPSRRTPAPANPFQGVRFGPPPEGGAAPRAARRAPDAAKPGEPQRTSTGTALSRVVLALPPPPPPDPPAAPAAPRFGPPPATTPAAPPVAAPSAPRFGPPPEDEELSLEPDEEIVAMDPEPAASHAPRGGPVVPKPSILPTAASTLAAVAALPRSSLLGVGAISGADIAPAEEIAPARPADATPHPAPPPAERARKPGFALGTTIVVSAITSLVVVIGLYVVGRRDGSPRPAASATASATTTAAPVTPPPAATATVAAAPSASASASAIAVNPADLPYGFGYLTVATPASANVYLSGKIAGPANAPLRVRCGRWFVRLAAPPESRYPEWVSQGETVVVACQQVTRVDMSAPQ